MTPRGREKVLRGAVGVARAIDLRAASTRLAALGAGVQLRVGDGALTLGRAPSQATATIVHAPLGAAARPGADAAVAAASTARSDW